MSEAYRELRKYLSAELSVSYTLRSDDITKGEKPQGTPYLSRQDELDERGIALRTGSRLTCVKRDGGICLRLETEREEVSEFGLNFPFNFMGKKNGGGWKKQYLFNSPYASSDGKAQFCYLSNPSGKGILLIDLGSSDGWKMDYSLFSGGQYFENLKWLYSFDKAYGGARQAEKRKVLRLFLTEVNDYDEGLKVAAEKLRRSLRS